MSDAGPYEPSEQELADLQKLSSEYEPEVTGPLVSERQSTAAVAAEYANSDPVYQAKTAALPREFPEFRSCRGDGHCGWRAVAFTYFEALQRIGDKNKFLEEETRLRSHRNLLNSVGFQEHLYEDFADTTFDLLRATSNALPTSDGGAALLASFNDDTTAMSIITYLKFLTSAQIKTHPQEYQPFLMGQSIDDFCNTHVEAAMCEIEHVGLTALMEVLIKPASLALEVMYLDRSAGEKMTPYRFEPVGSDGLPLRDTLTIRLLYRPGHYDILYKQEDIQPAITEPVYVGLVGSTPEYIPTDSHVSYVAAHLPGMSIYEGPVFGAQDWTTTESFFPNASAIPIHPMPSVPCHYEPVPHMPTQHAEYIPPPTHSAYEFEPDYGSGQRKGPEYTTSIFRNSHYNTAHYMNPEFQPEEWTPESEGVTGAARRSRRKSSSH